MIEKLLYIGKHITYNKKNHWVWLFNKQIGDFDDYKKWKDL